MTTIRGKQKSARKAAYGPHVEEALAILGASIPAPDPARTRQARKEYDRSRQKARQRAYRRLAEAHGAEFEILLREEMEIVGLPRFQREGD